MSVYQMKDLTVQKKVQSRMTRCNFGRFNFRQKVFYREKMQDVTQNQCESRLGAEVAASAIFCSQLCIY